MERQTNALTTPEISNVLTTPEISPETVERFKEAFAQAAKITLSAIMEVWDALAPAVKAILECIGRWSEEPLRMVATSKEWHIYKHTKKKRIREKYKKRFKRRLAFILAGKGVGNE